MPSAWGNAPALAILGVAPGTRNFGASAVISDISAPTRAKGAINVAHSPAHKSRPTFNQHADDSPVRQTADVIACKCVCKWRWVDELSSYCFDGGRVGRSVQCQG